MFPTAIVVALATGAAKLILVFGVVYLAIRLALKKQQSVSDAPTPEVLSKNETTPEQLAKSQSPTEPSPIKHAFDFEDERVAMILEMPTSMLTDDEALAAGWVDVVSWARMAWQDIQEGRAVTDETPAEDAPAALDESEITREHLEGSLQRLHDAAERRRDLRMKLAEKQHGAPAAEAPE